MQLVEPVPRGNEGKDGKDGSEHTHDEKRTKEGTHFLQEIKVIDDGPEKHKIDEPSEVPRIGPDPIPPFPERVKHAQASLLKR